MAGARLSRSGCPVPLRLVVPLREQLTRDQWDGLSTDQREKLLGAQALDHLVYGDKLDVATAGCR